LPGLGNTTIAPDRQGVTAGGLEVDLPASADSSASTVSIDEHITGLTQALRGQPGATVDEAITIYRKQHPELSDADIRKVKLMLSRPEKGTSATEGVIGGLESMTALPGNVATVVADVNKALTRNAPANTRSQRLLAGGS